MKKFIIRAISLLLGLVLTLNWLKMGIRESGSIELADESYLETALLFADASYVRDWDGPFQQTVGPFSVYNWSSSRAFNRLIIDDWNILFNEIVGNESVPQDVQVLTGSKIDAIGNPIFVIAFRGSDKSQDYLYTNFKNYPVPLETVIVEANSDSREYKNDLLKASYIPTITDVWLGSLITWVSNILPGSPALVHGGYSQQVLFSLSAQIVDPSDGSRLNILQAIDKYPEAELIITGHSSGGAAAQIFSVLMHETGRNELRRIRTRTFAAAGSFNLPGKLRYRGLDCRNFTITGDPILYANELTGFQPISYQFLLAIGARNKDLGNIHKIPTYEDCFNAIMYTK